MNADLLTRESLQRLYVDQRLNTVQIAKLAGCSSVTVWKRLRRFGIPTRSRAEARRLYVAHGAAPKRLSRHDRAMLTELEEYGDLSEREARRMCILLALDRGKHPRAVAAAQGVTKAFVHYMWREYRKRGWAAIIHGNEGKIEVNGERL